MDTNVICLHLSTILHELQAGRRNMAVASVPKGPVRDMKL